MEQDDYRKKLRISGKKIALSYLSFGIAIACVYYETKNLRITLAAFFGIYSIMCFIDGLRLAPKKSDDKDLSRSKPH